MNVDCPGDGLAFASRYPVVLDVDWHGLPIITSNGVSLLTGIDQFIPLRCRWRDGNGLVSLAGDLVRLNNLAMIVIINVGHADLLLVRRVSDIYRRVVSRCRHHGLVDCSLTWRVPSDNWHSISVPCAGRPLTIRNFTRYLIDIRSAAQLSLLLNRCYFASWRRYRNRPGDHLVQIACFHPAKGLSWIIGQVRSISLRFVRGDRHVLVLDLNRHVGITIRAKGNRVWHGLTVN